MRSDLIRVTKPTWVRIVNPEPFSLPALGYDYRYGDVLLTRPGGGLQPISNDGARVLAVYRAPHPPHDKRECPTDALLLAPASDLRLMAQGKIGYLTRLDPELDTGMKPAPLPPCRIGVGQQARVPANRAARVMPPPHVRRIAMGGAYRTEEGQELEQPDSEPVILRPGGVLTAIEHRGAHVRVFYRPEESYDGLQCEAGAWFWMPALEFVTMETRYQVLRALEEQERQLVIRLRDRV